MIQESDENIIRKHLLGRLTEEERSHAEEKLFTDDDYFELLTVIEDELIDDYISGDLTEEDRKQFEAHFLSTPERSERLGFARTLNEYASREDVPNPTPIPQPAWWKQLLSSPYFGLAAAAAAVIVIGLTTWQWMSPEPEASRGIAALNKAYSDQRPIESRITGFGYAPPPPVTRGGEQEKFDYVARDRAQALIQLEAAEHPSARSYHDLGRLYLTQYEFDKAIDQFEKALAQEDKNAQLHNDYGVALMEKGKKEDSGKRLETFSRALEHLNKAVELDSSLLEALFNRAILYQHMMLFQDAEEAWRKYLEKDPNSKWADEARRNLKTIEEQRSRSSLDKESYFNLFLSAYRAGDDDRAWEAFSRCHVRAGNFITERLIDNYLELITKQQRGQANNVLKVLSYAGELQYRRAVDRFTSDLAQFYKSSAFRNQTTLITARAAIKLAQEQIAQSHMNEALETYTQAKRSFDQIGDRSEARFAEYWMGICSSQINPHQGIATFQQLTRACEQDDYKSLAIRSLNGLANNYLSLNSYSKAISYSNPSLSLARQTQDSYGCVLALSHLISAYKPLGNFEQCLNYLYPFLDLAAANSLEPVQACLCYAQTAWVLSSRDLNVAALDYQKTALEMALQLKELTMICTAYVHLAMIEARLNRYSEALTNAQKALQLASERSTESAGSRMMAYSFLHLGSLYRQNGDLDKAIASYNQSIELYERIDFPAFIYLGRKGLFASLADSGNVLRAKEELDKTISYYESQRAKITEQSNRDSFFDLEQDVYDLAIDFGSVKLNNPQIAFEYSESSRGRSLLDSLYQGSQITNGVYGPEELFSTASPSLNLDAIQGSLPEHAQILQYAVLEDKIESWVITRDSFKPYTSKIALKELGKQVQGFLRLIANPKSDQDLSRAGTELYKVLIGPAKPDLDENKLLFIIPDKILNFLPFQSLVSPSNGKYLIEDYALALSPSSSVLITCTNRAKGKGPNDEESLLSVGIRHFAHRESDDLADMPSAVKEAKSIADLYKPSSALIEERATKQAVMSEISNANVVHFASHFIRNPFSSMRSKLLLATENQAARNDLSMNGDLESAEIRRMNLSAVRLAVLSACQTGIEQYYRGEGAISIARTFIATGVPLVVASLWRVDSDATAELMIRFHGFRKRGESSSIEALRSAQRSMLDEPNGLYRHPYYWASFNLIGGVADY